MDTHLFEISTQQVSATLSLWGASCCTTYIQLYQTYTCIATERFLLMLSPSTSQHVSAPAGHPQVNHNTPVTLSHESHRHFNGSIVPNFYKWWVCTFYNKSPRKSIAKSTYSPFVKIRNNGSVEVAMAFVRQCDWCVVIHLRMARRGRNMLWSRGG
jgi:hypothetical protein